MNTDIRAMFGRKEVKNHDEHRLVLGRRGGLCPLAQDRHGQLLVQPQDALRGRTHLYVHRRGLRQRQPLQDHGHLRQDPSQPVQGVQSHPSNYKCFSSSCCSFS